jgi:hypothetical protein
MLLAPLAQALFQRAYSSSVHRCVLASTVQVVPTHHTHLLAKTGYHHAAWLFVPAADDAYVRKLASFLRDGLRPDLRVYVKHSNEVWNQAFPQVRV